ncbi:flagellar hook-length control protein FliK [Novilysobacter arseniciresistens]|uniref:flagellar hook-length control protein FliK n=1 Tax=Novilysobacter arseniciresistens TaxID=1385522 RepID=UPI00126A6FDA|nr:flagellar hook-length control protein FliK [Lysobacter arseniciresistens]
MLDPAAARPAAGADARASQSRGSQARDDGSRSADERSRAGEATGAAGSSDASPGTAARAERREGDGDASAATKDSADARGGDAADATLPDQLFAMIGGWRETAPAPGIGPPPSGAPGGTAAMPAATLFPTATADGLPATLLASGPVAATTPAGAAATSDTAASTLAGLAPLPAMPVATDTAVGSAGSAPPVDFAPVLEQSADGTSPDLIPEFETGERTLPPGATGSTPTGARPVTAAGQPPLAFPADPDAGFDDAFGARIGWLAEQRIGHAEIRLNPETLGTIDVRLQIDGTRVVAEFQSAHADVRHALENSVGRLRELLGQHGLQLAHSDVGQGRGDGAGDSAGGRAGTVAGNADGIHADGRSERAPVQLRTRGLLDEYA